MTFSSAALRSEILLIRDLDKSDVSLYRSLYEQHLPFRSPFLTFSFAEAVAAVNPQARIARLLHQENVHGFVPFQLSSSPFGLTRYATKIGGHMSDCFSMIGPRADLNRVQTLADLLGVDTFWYDHYPVENLCGPPTTGDTSIGKVINFDADPEVYWRKVKNANKTFYQTLMRRKRKIEREIGPIRFDFQSKDHSLLDVLIEKKKEQYARTNVGDAFHVSWTIELLHRLLDIDGAEDLQPFLSVMYVGDKFAAAHFGLMEISKIGKTFHYWMPVYSADYFRYSPGHLMRYCMTNELIAAGAQSMDCGGGDNLDKDFYVPTNYAIRHGLAYRHSLGGFVGRAEHSLMWRWRALRSPKSQSDQ